MMKNKLKTYKMKDPESVITLAGFLLFGVSIIATAFDIYHNYNFINNIWALIYYLSPVLLLIGGFCIGYLMFKKSKSKIGNHPSSAVLVGMIHSLIAFATFYLLDVIRVCLQNIFDYSSTLWFRVGFESLSIITLLVVLLISIIVKSASDKDLMRLKLLAWILPIVFVIQQAAGSMPLGDITMTSDFVVSIITLPIVVALVAFLLLGNIKDISRRLLCSSMIGVIYLGLTTILWSFRTNPEASATMVFGKIVMIVSILAIIPLIMSAKKRNLPTK